MAPLETSLQHILAELERIDLLLQVQVWRARQRMATDEAFQGLVIQEEEVDALLAQPAGLPRWVSEPEPWSQIEVQTALAHLSDDIARRKAASLRQGVTLRLDKAARLFDLAPFDLDILLICLAPEIDLRYERLYAYLQDDVTKKRPSVDLALNLLSPSLEAKLANRRRFTPAGPLSQHDLVGLFDDPSHVQPPLLSKYLKADERIVAYLLGADDVDARLAPYASMQTADTRLEDLLLPADLKRRLALLARAKASGKTGVVFYFQGPYGVGKQATAQALCRELGIGLLVVDGERLLTAEMPAFERIVRLAAREALLQDAALYWDHFDLLLDEEPGDAELHIRRRACREMLLRTVERRPGVTFLAGNAAWEPADALADTPFVRVELPRPAYAERLALWRRSLDGHAATDGRDLEALAVKFRLSGGQIRDAATTAANLARWRDPANGHVTAADLYAASRLQSNRKLASLAQKVEPHYTWDDIVLPADRMAQLRELCNTVRYRAVVYEDWGFGRKLSLGKGLNVLFAGPSGTGKTMAAEIIANELGLDLYKIDLSTVVSKYIGETEKNLARIFTEAETSNAILFFDEADALFGKRSEVRDSHDRYANIEISYLLQRMEEYDGMAILATNLHKNMDEAFVRRMHFTVEFPFPDAGNRRRIWEKIWPAETPRSTDLDLALMARRFELAGGSIRNIALAAAFLAADDGQVVDMGHVIRATQREYRKMGKVVTEREFEVKHESA
jgi:SpoVK/Ycf46/Vps4 family AAA+-type ATPase